MISKIITLVIAISLFLPVSSSLAQSFGVAQGLDQAVTSSMCPVGDAIDSSPFERGSGDLDTNPAPRCVGNHFLIGLCGCVDGHIDLSNCPQLAK